MRRIIFLVLFAWLAGFVLFIFSFSPPNDAGKTDAIVVLTGSAGRITRGIEILKRQGARRMLISGVDLKVKPRELAVQYDTPMAIFRCCIDLGHQAVDTRSNADETANWVKSHHYRSVRLVTSNWHMPRAALELRHALGSGVKVVEDPVREHPDLALLFGEYNKYLLRRAALALGLGR